MVIGLHVCWSIRSDIAKGHEDLNVRYEMKFILQRAHHHTVWVPTHFYSSFFREVCKENEASIKVAVMGKKEKCRQCFGGKTLRKHSN